MAEGKREDIVESIGTTRGTLEMRKFGQKTKLGEYIYGKHPLSFRVLTHTLATRDKRDAREEKREFQG